MMIYNPWLIREAGKYIAEAMAAYIRARDREESEFKKERDKEKKEKDEIAFRNRILEEEYKRKNPRCTHMFEHYSMYRDCAVKDDYSWKGCPRFCGWTD